MKKRLLFGVGINDANYVLHKTEVINGRKVVLWTCPYYSTWKGILRRSYSEVALRRSPTYRGCSVHESWKTFSKFKLWMESQPYSGKQIDKDILIPGNKVYGPDTCVFVDSFVNSFLLEAGARRGKWPIGVSFHKLKGKFVARCHCVTADHEKHLGFFADPSDAHSAWLSFKLSQAKILASMQTDKRVADAIVARYENYQPR